MSLLKFLEIEKFTCHVQVLKICTFRNQIEQRIIRYSRTGLNLKVCQLRTSSA